MWGMIIRSSRTKLTRENGGGGGYFIIFVSIKCIHKIRAV